MLSLIRINEKEFLRSPWYFVLEFYNQYLHDSADSQTFIIFPK